MRSGGYEERRRRGAAATRSGGNEDRWQRGSAPTRVGADEDRRQRPAAAQWTYTRLAALPALEHVCCTSELMARASRVVFAYGRLGYAPDLRSTEYHFIFKRSKISVARPPPP